MQTTTFINTCVNHIASYRVCYVNCCAQLSGKSWLCICVEVEPPFLKSWIRHWSPATPILTSLENKLRTYLKWQASQPVMHVGVGPLKHFE